MHGQEPLHWTMKMAQGNLRTRKGIFDSPIPIPKKHQKPSKTHHVPSTKGPLPFKLKLKLSRQHNASAPSARADLILFSTYTVGLPKPKALCQGRVSFLQQAPSKMEMGNRPFSNAVWLGSRARVWAANFIWFGPNPDTPWDWYARQLIPLNPPLMGGRECVLK